MEAGSSDHLPSPDVDRDQSATGRHRVAKEPFEDSLFVTIFWGMLFPKERICGNGVEVAKVVGAKRPKLDELAA